MYRRVRILLIERKTATGRELHQRETHCHQIKKNEIGEEFSKHGRNKKFIQSFGWKT
jgi:hypothetical protein